MIRLLERIKERVATLTRGRSKKTRALELPPPATAAEIAKAEARLGFQLPPLLKNLYLEIANGGFGPSEGFLGVPTRKSTFRLSLLKAYRNCTHGRQWPEHLLPVVYCGCEVFFCIDCDHRTYRVITFDGYLGDLEECDISEPRSQWPYPDSLLAACFQKRAKSFTAFLEMWLEEESQLFCWV
jgi:hypothetical protein